jgi:predicted nucleic-acid-binding Zn-ribbon protein
MVYLDQAREKSMGQINETKCNCNACQHEWFYGKKDVDAASLDNLQNLGKNLMCCGGCFPALLIPEAKTTDFNKCPKCGSRAIEKKVITHNV